MNPTIYIIANATIGTGMSGGDRIYIECARYWARAGCNINIIAWEDGYNLCRRNNLEGINYIIWSASRYRKLGFPLFYLWRTIKGNLFASRIKLNEGDIIYSSSDFWMDSIPAFIMKLRNKDIKWIAGFYLFMLPPWDNDFPYRGKRIIVGLLYWLMQRPIYYIVNRYADMVFVTSEPDRKKFKPIDKVLVIRGGVDLELAKKVEDTRIKDYDAVFIGRFHPQKGVLELIDIWAKVCARKKDARLAIIGEGQLEREIRYKIARHNIERNVNILGFLDGVEKIKVFKSSRIVLHPAIYDSGGMGPCEAMSCGLPGVSFDLEALRTYYPKGMLKVPCYDKDRFAESILQLISDNELYNNLQRDALDWAREWDWANKANEILERIRKLVPDTTS